MVAISALGFSIIASIVLTIVLNLVLFLFPGAARRLRDAFDRLAERSDQEPNRVRVIFPWKAMLIGSLVLTILINVALALMR
jgi:hypothetical protein